jgi:putative acetyltransferase
VEVTIRAYDPRDAADLADVFFRSVRQVALSDYTAAQVRAWAPEPRTAEWAHREASDGRLVLVAANEDDRPVAYIDLEPNGHIDRLFRAPEATGQGIASRLYDAVEAAAREQGIRSLFTEASELARRLFEHKGFAIVERQDLVIRGVAIHNYRMAKPQSTGHLGPMPACQNERCPLTWDDGSCEASRTRFERTPCKCDCCIASRGPAHRSTTRISCRTPGWSR